ncbi:uncharacterized protein LOC122529192 [Frieseomelitta varia]|uniref:uncharacterized protein LOC122529192 n=1 Tax=Frieseomelitta varia TaxID=561572 RepID=UPI001CB6B34E|nr:uncharacterized protein LOC122529192 [Frieseomelitta varia]
MTFSLAMIHRSSWNLVSALHYEQFLLMHVHINALCIHAPTRRHVLVICVQLCTHGARQRKLMYVVSRHVKGMTVEARIHDGKSRSRRWKKRSSPRKSGIVFIITGRCIQRRLKFQARTQ